MGSHSARGIMPSLRGVIFPAMRYGLRTLYIEPGSPWENGYLESFNGKLRQEKLNGEIFYTLREAQVLIEQWRLEYNTLRPHNSLNYRPPAPEAWLH
jgi:putative transposase